MKQKLKKYIVPFLKEMLPVIAGILIALFIDNWNDERKNNRYIDQVFSSINSELKESNEDINENIPLQKSLIDSLETYSNDVNMSVLDIMLTSGGITIPTIKTSTWKAVSNSKIDLVSYKKIVALSNIEEQKEILKSKSDYLMHFLYSNLYATDKQKKEVLKILLLDIIQTEKTTLQYIDSFETL